MKLTRSVKRPKVYDQYLDVYETCEHILTLLQVDLRDMEHDHDGTKGELWSTCSDD